MDPFPRTRRYWHTIRHLRAAQIVSRIELRTRAAARNLSPPITRSWYARRAARAGLAFEPDPWKLRGATAMADWISPAAAAVLEREAAGVARGAFLFLNQSRELGWPVDWTAPAASQLWRYHLHYFDYVPDLLVAGRGALVPQLMTDWVARVPLAHAATRDAWHPYVVSVRLVNWMLALAAAPFELHEAHSILESLRVQTLFVRDNLETDVGGNHLLKNLKAVAIAGCFWRGERARALRDRFTAAFVQALNGQLRTDGGHYEQSPMYHAQVLGDAIELALVLRHAVGPNRDLEGLISRMRAFVSRVRHPDGGLVQFGDTAAGMTPAPDALIAAADALQDGDPARRLVPRHALLACSLSLKGHVGTAGVSDGFGVQLAAAAGSTDAGESWDPDASGFVALATDAGRGFLIVGAGPVCPDDLPAHAHADLFGFEISVDGRRVVVDSGVSEYAAGPWRDYYRSTRAHNTVMVDGTEQSECWGSFRVARRARVVDGRFEVQAGMRGFSAAHTGFTHLRSPVVHRRRFLLVSNRFWLIVDDLLGAGAHRWETYLHLHPEVKTANMSNSGCVATRAGVALQVRWFGIDAPACVIGQANPLQGWYAPAFGQVFPAPTLVGTGSGRLPRRFGWLLVPLSAGADEPFNLEVASAERLTVRSGCRTYEVTVEPLTESAARARAARRKAPGR